MEKCCESCMHYDTDRVDQPCCSCFGCSNWEEYKECVYCGREITKGAMCNSCYDKHGRVTVLCAILRRIKEWVENDR